MKKYVLLLSVTTFFLVTNHAYSQYNVLSGNQTVTDCASSAQDGADNGSGLFTISPTACNKIKLTINQEDNQLLIIREGTDGTGTIIYTNSSVQLVELTTDPGVSSVTIQFNHQDNTVGNEYLITWQGLFASDGASTNNACFGDNNGTAQLFPTGGTSGYTYN
ncbi:MAG TPA: hypothetical protein DEQ03_03485, partial [Marinilabiliales bacterium]|nr:hypothetical protein [Marinilabiliales bacterium]